MLIICPECDLAQQCDTLEAGESVHCVRCNAEITSNFADKLDRAMAALATSAVLLVIMNVFPLVAMRVQGTSRMTTLFGAVTALYQNGMIPIAVLVLITTIVGPAIEITVLSLILFPARSARTRRSRKHLIDLIQHIHPWSMIEVFMLGVLVSLVKLAALAEITPGPALWACAALIVTLSYLRMIIRPRQLWQWLDQEST